MDSGGPEARNESASAEDLTSDSGRLVVAFIVAFGLCIGKFPPQQV